MKNKIIHLSILLLILILMTFCKNPDSANSQDNKQFTGAKGEVILLTLDPGHFHAALVQKSMKEEIHPEVYIYAPDGPDVDDHIQRITGFNRHPENPTSWITLASWLPYRRSLSV